ncbi:MAG: hypothetical protein KIT83_17835 [Bryobacterales bacterium]|nr:hypothetical protein [Bryobacterales bacterium]
MVNIDITAWTDRLGRVGSAGWHRGAWLLVMLALAASGVWGQAPTLTLLTPDNAVAGSGPVALTVTGTNFASGAVVVFGTTDLTTSFVGATSLTASIPNSLLQTEGLVAVTVRNPNTDVSNDLPFTINDPPPPAPTLTLLSPDNANANSGPVALTVTGTNFVSGAVVVFGTTDLTTSFVGATSLTASIPNSLLQTAGPVSVTVRNPNNDVSNGLTFTVNDPTPSAPTLTLLAPNNAIVSSGPVALTVSGTNFVSGAVVGFGAIDLVTVFDSANSLTATIPAIQLATIRTVNVTVRNPDGQTSAGLPFAVEAPPPTLSAINPNSAVEGNPATILSASGANFVSGAVIRFGSTDLTTAFASPGNLSATIPASLLTTAGTVNVTVRNPDAKLSAALPFTISPRADSPTLSSLAPDRAPAGSPATILVLTGTNFTSSSRVNFRGTELVPTASTATTLTVTIPASLLETPGIAAVLVSNQGANSNSLSFTVQPSFGAPVLTLLSPSSAPVGTVNLVLTISGSNFVTGAAVLFGTSVVLPSNLTDSSLTAAIPAALLATSRNVTVTVRNPGGQTSNGLNFAVGNPGPPPGTELNISVQSLPVGVVGQPYGPEGAGVTIQTVAGTPPYTIDIATEGIGQLQAAGFQVERPNATTPGNPVLLRISGTPTTTGQITVRVVARDGAGTELQRDLPLVVVASALSIAPPTLPAATVGLAYQQTLTLVGLSPLEQSPPEGQPVATWELISPPAGLSINNAGVLSGTFPTTGTLGFSVRATTSLRSVTQSYSLLVDIVRPVIVTEALPTATIGTPYTAEIQASGGTPGYTWQIAGISLPAGLTFDAASVNSPTLRITGTPSAGAETRTFSLTVRDSLNQTGTREFTLAVSAVPIPALSFAPIANPAPREQRDVLLTLAQPYPLPLTGTATITFQPNATNNADDPNVRFVVGTDGGRSAAFQIDANSTNAVFPNASPQRLQTGTVAGTIRLRAAISGNGPVKEEDIVIARSAPSILDLTLQRTNDGFTVSLTGFSTPRDLTNAQFTFTAPAGSGLQTTQLTIALTDAATTWYNSDQGRANGSSFRLTIPFTVQGGANPVQSVSVTLSNSVGASAPRSASF